MSNDDNRNPTSRVAWFDGITPTDQDFIAEQNGQISRSTNIVKDFHGSGVLNRTPSNLQPILNTSQPLQSNISYSALMAGTFDGKGIFVDRQPLDNTFGNQLLLTLSGSATSFSTKTKVYIFGKTYDQANPQGKAILEPVVFDGNGQRVTYNYFTSVIGIFFNNLSGGSGRTEINNASVASYNVSDVINNLKATVVISEVDPLRVADASLVLQQTSQPNLFLRDFITSSVARRFQDELTVLINTAQNRNYVNTSLLDLNQLPLSGTGLNNKPYLDSTNVGTFYGQKIYLPTDNIQQLSLALSVESGTAWSGEIVIGIRKLQTKSINQFANQIDLDPEPNTLFETSFTYSSLQDLGYQLTTTSQEIKFNFISSPISLPGSLLVKDTYYILTITRRGDVSQGKILIDVGSKSLIDSKFTSFNTTSQAWTDDANTDLWFKVYSAAIRITSGVAYTNDGNMVSIQKTAKDESGNTISAIAGPYSLKTVDANASDNIVVLQHIDTFADISDHPRTGNPVFLRVIDGAEVAVYNAADFATLVASSDLPPLILGKINDYNSKLDNAFNGTMYLPGQVQKNSVLLINSGLPQNIVYNNKVFIPDVSSPNTKYRITNFIFENRLLGDFNGDKLFSSTDVIKESEVADMFSGQGSTPARASLPYPITDTRARDILAYGAETLEDFELADLDGNLIINSLDEARLTYLANTLPVSVTPQPSSINFQSFQLDNIIKPTNSTVITQTPTADGYAVDFQTVFFNAPFIQDLRAMSVGDKITLSTSPTFATTSFDNLIITKFVQKNDMIISTRFNRTVSINVDQSYVLSFFGYDPNRILNGVLTKQQSGNPSAIGDGYMVATPTPHLIGTSVFHLNFPPNTFIVSSPYSNSAAGIQGSVTAHWTSGGVAKSMTFSVNPVSVSGDGDPQSSILNRLNGTLLLNTGQDIPDQGTPITADYNLAPVSTLKHCYPTSITSVAGLTNVEFKVPFATFSSNPLDSNYDSYGINPSAYSVSNLPYVLIQADQAIPPTIVNQDSFGIIPGRVLGNSGPQLQVKAIVTDINGNNPNLTSGNYYVKVVSGSSVNLPAVQKQFVGDSFGVSYNPSTQIVSITSPTTWQIQQVNFEWAPNNMAISDLRRYVPVSLTKFDNNNLTTSNKIVVPSDLIINSGEILNGNGIPYHGDIEITKINLSLPLTSLLSNSINIYNDLIASYVLTPGTTRAGYQAMKFSDGSYVGQDDTATITALNKNQVRIIPSIGSINIDATQVPNATSYSDLDEILTKLHYEMRMGTYFDDASGILYFHVEGLKDVFANEPIVQTGTVKVVIDVALKKSGFRNNITTLGEADVTRLLTNASGSPCAATYSIAGEVAAGFVVGKSTPSSC